MAFYPPTPPRKKEESLHKAIGYVVYLNYISKQNMNKA